MSNLLNFALGGLSGALTGSPLTAAIGIPVAALTTSPGSAAPAAGFSSLLSRDGQMPELGEISSAVNLLQQVAGALGAGGSTGTDGSTADQQQLTLPPAAPMPAPAKPAAVPTDDHGQSNIVFSDGDADGSLIH